jgi:serine protein kinase
MASSINFRSMVQNYLDKSNLHMLHWSGTFDEYLDLVKKNPKISRNAFQRMFDMIIEAGTEEYVDFKKPVVRYKFFVFTNRFCNFLSLLINRC